MPHDDNFWPALHPMVMGSGSGCVRPILMLERAKLRHALQLTTANSFTLVVTGSTAVRVWPHQCVPPVCGLMGSSPLIAT